MMRFFFWTNVPRALWALSLVVCQTGVVCADAWQLTMQTGDDASQNLWLVDEKLGLRMQMPQQPDLEIILRTDLRQNVWVHKRQNVFALQPWNSGRLQGGTPVPTPRSSAVIRRAGGNLQGLSPAARVAAERALTERYGRMTDGRPQAAMAPRSYRLSGSTQKIRQFDCQEVVELAAGRPTGRVFWVSQVPGWEKMSTAMQQALDQFAMIPADQRIPWKELGGIPVEISEPQGQVSRLLDVRPIPSNLPQMQPPPRAQQVDFLTLMGQISNRAN